MPSDASEQRFLDAGDDKSLGTNEQRSSNVGEQESSDEREQNYPQEDDCALCDEEFPGEEGTPGYVHERR